MKLLEIEMDNTLFYYFYKYISNLCKNSKQSIKCDKKNRFNMGFEEKEMLLNTLVPSNFNYCPIVRHFCSSKSLKKIEKIQERVLRILYNHSTSDYNQLLNKSSKASMEVKRLRNLALEIFKTLNTSKKYFIELKILHIDPLI